MFDFETDIRIRGAALKWLDHAKKKHPHGAIHAQDNQDVYFQIPDTDERIRVLLPLQGIWKPQQMQACLSVISNHNSVYRDAFDKKSDGKSGLIYYEYRADGGYDHPHNKSLRLAMEYRRPVIYFRTFAPGRYLANLVLILQESPDKTGVMLRMQAEDVKKLEDDMELAVETNQSEAIHRTYLAKSRLHQAEFRHRIMQAYEDQCAVCHFKHLKLLDAAHIIPDSQGGRPEVSNGLSLCRIHHGAYDQNMLGIDPDYKIHINKDMLRETDGPMLKHGFQNMSQQNIYQPTQVNKRPDRDKLAERFDGFRNNL